MLKEGAQVLAKLSIQAARSTTKVRVCTPEAWAHKDSACLTPLLHVDRCIREGSSRPGNKGVDLVFASESEVVL